MSILSYIWPITRTKALFYEIHMSTVNSTHRHLVSTWDHVVQRKLCELRLNIDQEAVLKQGYLCRPYLSDLCLQRDFTVLSVKATLAVTHMVSTCYSPLHVVCHVTWYCNLINWFAKIPGRLHNAVNSILLPDPLQWGWGFGCETNIPSCD